PKPRQHVRDLRDECRLVAGASEPSRFQERGIGLQNDDVLWDACDPFLQRLAALPGDQTADTDRGATFEDPFPETFRPIEAVEMEMGESDSRVDDLQQ